MSEMNFEKAMERLNEITAELESGELELDKSMERFEEGLKRIAMCRKKLENTKAKISKLSGDGSESEFNTEG